MNGFKNCLIITGRPLSEYFTPTTERGHAMFTISQGQLIEFAKCPQRWRMGYNSPDSEAKAWGGMVDCMLLTPEEWSKRYVVQPETYTAKDGEQKPWRNDKRIKEVAAWLEAGEGKTCLKAETVESVRAAVARVKQDDELSDLLTTADRQVWVCGQYHDAATGLDVPVKALIDVAPKSTSLFWADYLGDFKTTRSADPRIWTRWVFDRKYHVQAAFYLDMFNAATGESRSKWFHIVQENFPPFEIGKRILSPAFIEMGRVLYRTWLANYARCLASGVWPSYDAASPTGWTETRPADWMATEEVIQAANLPGDPGDDSDLNQIAPEEEAA